MAATTVAAVAAPAAPRDAVPVAADAAQEARVMALAAELRCLVCQNQTIADSHAGLAVDLRQQIREMLSQGKTDDDIRSFMTQRYGDFVLYNPPLKTSTALLWVGPPLLLAGALGALVTVLRRRQRAAPEAFDPDSPDDAGALDVPQWPDESVHPDRRELRDVPRTPDAPPPAGR